MVWKVGPVIIIDAAGLRRIRRGFVVLLILGTGLWALMVAMPGRSWRGPLPPLTDEQTALRDALQADVEQLASEIGVRNILTAPRALQAADGWITAQWEAAGYTVQRQEYEVLGETVANLWVELPGTQRPDDVFVVGAHYDSVDCPGANDNGTGVATTLALARRFAGQPQAVTLRFAAFVNEEPPFFWTESMGSLVYARELKRQHVHVVGMWTPETLGYYRDEPGTQRYPGLDRGNPFRLFYPGTGNFITFVGDVRSRGLIRRSIGTFRQVAQFPSEGMAASNAIAGIGWSDHWSFGKVGYPNCMITDTAPFRYPHYHQQEDTPDKIDFDRFARVVDGLGDTLERLTAR